MGRKVVFLGIVWVCVIFSYLALALVMPVVRSMSSTAATELDASANMSHFPGTKGTVESSPYWLWAIPGSVGMVLTVVTLRKKD